MNTNSGGLLWALTGLGRHGDIDGFWILMNDDLGAALLQAFYQ